MANRISSLQGVRNEIITSLFGRRLGIDKNDLLVGQQAVRAPMEGWSSDGSTFPSTGTASLMIGGVAVCGSSGSSGSTAASPSCQQLPAPVPGVEKTLYNISTAVITYGTSAAAAFFQGTAGSTYQYLTLAGRGANCDIIGLTTALYGIKGNIHGSSFSTNVSLI